MEMRHLEGGGIGKGIMFPPGECKKSKRPPGCRSCFPVAGLLGWLKDPSGSGDTVGAAQPPSAGEPVEVAVEERERGGWEGRAQPCNFSSGFCKGRALESRREK